MDLNLEMFISKWHLITLFFTAVALFAMIIGKYPRKTVIKSTILTFLIIYVVFTVFIGFEMQETEERNNYVDEGLTSSHEQNMGKINEELVVFVGGFYDDEDDFTSKVYAKNFHESAEFTGKVRVAIYNEEGNKLEDEVYDVTLQPGEKIEVDPYLGNEEFGRYRYQFNPSSN
ncbi:hypothetical protein VBD025_08640 [Virgibacillus flavescens]|uniref:hypothetical protein n=1 Tax=Virgibacillus flavescens TaxID=1611422 RepID=UPI003D3391EE